MKGYEDFDTYSEWVEYQRHHGNEVARAQVEAGVKILIDLSEELQRAAKLAALAAEQAQEMLKTGEELFAADASPADTGIDWGNMATSCSWMLRKTLNETRGLPRLREAAWDASLQTADAAAKVKETWYEM
jgi:hypothetical protein